MFVGTTEEEVVLLAVEFPVVVALREAGEEAPTEPCRRLTVAEVDDVVVEEVLATAVIVSKGIVDALTLAVDVYER